MESVFERARCDMSFDYFSYLIHQVEVIAVEILIAVGSIALLIQFLKNKLKK
jgi:hypothetical protein